MVISDRSSHITTEAGRGEDQAATLARYINTLVKAGETSIESLAEKGGAPLPAPVDRPRIGAATGIGRTKGSPAPQSGNGIASPLTEVSRSLHATQAISSDGLFVWSVPDTITMVDALGRTVEFVYAAPT